jgi:hypothetical protein
VEYAVISAWIVVWVAPFDIELLTSIVNHYSYDNYAANAPEMTLAENGGSAAWSKQIL